MARKLIIVTNEFPYGKRETFLESEIQVISRDFEEIVILPCKTAEGKRVLPLNVVVDTTLADAYSNKKEWALKAMLSPFTIATFLKYGGRGKGSSFYKFLFKYCIAHKIVSTHSGAIIKKYSNPVIYSYWFSHVADAFSINKGKADFKLVTRAHRGDLYEEFTILKFYPYREQSIHKIDAVYSISEDGKQYLTKRFNADNIHCSKLGVFDSGYISKKPAQGNVSLVSVSNIIPVKRVDLIAESVVLYATQHPAMQVVWHHFGHGSLAGDVIQYLRDNAPSNLKHVFHGMVSNSEIFKFYKEEPVNLFINLSESEGIPVSIMEAISFGIPILATNVGGVAEIVGQDTGLMLDASCTAALVSNSISKLIDGGPAPETVKGFWADNYHAEKNYSAFSKMLNSL